MEIVDYRKRTQLDFFEAFKKYSDRAVEERVHDGVWLDTSKSQYG